jgi:hypothetical protein
MIPLFGDSDANGKRDVLEGRMITVALQLLRLETNVVLDFWLLVSGRTVLPALANREPRSIVSLDLPASGTKQAAGADQGSMGERA